MEMLQLVSYDYFNLNLLRQIEEVQLDSTPFNDGERPFNELGVRESMSIFDFLARAEGIAHSLKGRVKLFLKRMEWNDYFLKNNFHTAKGLIEQFEKLKQSKEKADQVLRGLQAKLSQYNHEGDKELLSSCEIVTNFAIANGVIGYLMECSAKLESGYLGEGTFRTYLPDRIATLKAAIQNMVQAIPVMQEAGEEAEL